MTYIIFPSSKGDAAPDLSKMERKKLLREQIERDVAAFLKTGGVIQQIPAGESAMEDSIYTNPLKQAPKKQKTEGFKLLDFTGQNRSRNLYH